MRNSFRLRQTDRHTDRQTDRQTDKHTDRQTDRQTDKDRKYKRSNRAEGLFQVFIGEKNEGREKKKETEEMAEKAEFNH